jgi:glyoxylase-like metal-dependent hydrolase (beta-lactamase superfamily II)
MTNHPANDNKVKPIHLGHVNTYLIQTETGYIFVDSGMPNSNQKLVKAFREYSVNPQDVHLIILTHGHLDHVGSVAFLQEITGGKVLCHRLFSGDLVKGKIEKAVPKNLLGRVLNIMTGFLGSEIEAVTPDIVMDDTYDLDEFGIAGKVIHTPGHSQSSVTIALDNGEVLVGDLMREEKPGVVGFGMFCEDLLTAMDSAKRIAALNPRVIYLSHGTTIDHTKLDGFIAAHQ